MLIEPGIYAKSLSLIFWRKLTSQPMDKLETCREVCTVNLSKALWTTYLMQKTVSSDVQGHHTSTAWFQSTVDGFKPLFFAYILPYNLYYVK